MESKLRALWNVLLGRPTIYRYEFVDGITIRGRGATSDGLITGCTFYHGGVQENHQSDVELREWAKEMARRAGMAEV